MFIQAAVITVKEDRSVKIAVDAGALSNNIRKDVCRMPNLDCLIEQIAEIINQKGERNTIFTSLDVLYAYGQTTLHSNTTKAGQPDVSLRLEQCLIAQSEIEWLGYRLSADKI